MFYDKKKFKGVKFIDIKSVFFKNILQERTACGNV